MSGLRLHLNLADYLILGLYFATVLGIGFLARRAIRTSADFFLSGRSLPAWVTGLAFVSANLGAIEILGMAANGAQYGLMTTHYYWVGAVPAMVFLGIVMMPFYYGSRVRSVPEYLRRRFNDSTHLLNAESLQRCKPGVRIINCARGGIIDETDLLAALESGQVAGAALDVTAVEPLPPDDPLLSFENVLVTPHIGSASVSTRSKMASLAVDNLLAFFQGERPPFCVNPEVLKA